MKISDIKVTLFEWISSPWKTGVGTTFGGIKQLGVLTIYTNEDIEGYAFLGSSGQGADAFVGPLMEFLKPLLIGRDPLDIGAIWYDMWQQNRRVSTNGHRRSRYCSLGHSWQSI